MPFLKGRNEDLGLSFRSPAALNKAATTALNKDKAVRVHKETAQTVPVRDCSTGWIFLFFCLGAGEREEASKAGWGVGRFDCC